MPGGFKELENITADLGLEAWGSDLEEAFTCTVQGLIWLLAGSPAGQQRLSRDIQIQAGSLPSLLVRLLNEIIYLEDAEDFIPDRVDSLSLRGNTLSATLTGDPFDSRIHTINVPIKAATYHGLEIEQTSERVTIKVIFDI